MDISSILRRERREREEKNEQYEVDGLTRDCVCKPIRWLQRSPGGIVPVFLLPIVYCLLPIVAIVLLNY